MDTTGDLLLQSEIRLHADLRSMIGAVDLNEYHYQLVSVVHLDTESDPIIDQFL
jgi:hypothetical protein